jgi:hypothetical protein
MKKIPIRKCVITGEQHPKKEMFRVVRTPEGTIEIDEIGKVRGHGVYLTKDKNVILKAKKKHALDNFLETSVPDEIYDKLIEALNNNE